MSGFGGCAGREVMGGAGLPAIPMRADDGAQDLVTLTEGQPFELAYRNATDSVG